MKDLYKTVLVILAIACVSSAGAVTYSVKTWGPHPDQQAGILSAFWSYDELRAFLGSGMGNQSYYGSSPIFGALSPESNRVQSPGTPYSQTNVQVTGVDEEDLVKTDGTYLYIASSSGVSIIQAYPPTELRNVSTIQAGDILGPSYGNVSASIQGLYVSNDRLIVVVTAYDQHWYLLDGCYGPTSDSGDLGPRTFVATYDISDASSPALVSMFGISGWELTSRMVGDVVYVVTQFQPWLTGQTTTLPSLWTGDSPEQIGLDKIRYDPETKEATGFVNVLAVDTHSGDRDWVSLVSGWGSTVYMSPDALFLTFQKWQGRLVLTGNETVAEREDTTRTTIYKIAVDGVQMTATARGDVSGWLLNQFALDQSGPYLRVATTTDWSDMKNNVYVLGQDLAVLGALKGLAPGERIFSSRFIGDKLYLITFRQTDPLFVIDLSNPRNPSVLGKLEMPGFSSYLQPLDDTHLLGIGSEGGNVKISLYDVTDPISPRETSKYVVNSSYSYSDAQWNHKAVLYDARDGLLVIPVTSYIYEDPWNVSTQDQGAFVFTISIKTGVSLKGVITHSETNYYMAQVLRSLYIGNDLYTVSQSQVRANSINDLADEGSLTYYVPPSVYPEPIYTNATIAI